MQEKLKKERLEKKATNQKQKVSVILLYYNILTHLNKSKGVIIDFHVFRRAMLKRP